MFSIMRLFFYHFHYISFFFFWHPQSDFLIQYLLLVQIICFRDAFCSLTFLFIVVFVSCQVINGSTPLSLPIMSLSFFRSLPFILPCAHLSCHHQLYSILPDHLHIAHRSFDVIWELTVLFMWYELVLSLRTVCSSFLCC